MAYPKFFAALALAWLTIHSTNTMAKDAPPEVTIDGLHRVADSKVDLLYVKPAIDLSTYTRVLLLDTQVSFVEGYLRRVNSNLYGSARVSQADMDAMKVSLAALFREEFTDELQNTAGYVVVDGVAADVLAVRPAILDLDVLAPEVRPNQRSAIPSVGEMTLYMELIDASSGDVLAKILDHRLDRTRVQINVRDADRNEAAARKIVRDWASLLREALDEAHKGSGH